MRSALPGILALLLGGCAATPLELSRRRPVWDGAGGPPRPGRSAQLGEEDWRHGEMRPPHVDPDTLFEGTDLPQQLDAWGDGPRGVIYGSSDEDGAAGSVIVPF
jgi:hypothetical protein